MSLSAALQVLDRVIPDDRVEASMREVLRREADERGMVRIELSEAAGGHVDVPVDATIEIVTKAFFKEYLEPTFGDFKVQVALGGACISPRCRLTARLCFATLLFNVHGQRFTVDFHLRAR